MSEAKPRKPMVGSDPNPFPTHLLPPTHPCQPLLKALRPESGCGHLDPCVQTPSTGIVFQKLVLFLRSSPLWDWTEDGPPILLPKGTFYSGVIESKAVT